MIKKRGEDGAPLPDREWALRLSARPKDFHVNGRASPKAFELSTTEKQDKPRKLSVFAESLTTPKQAWIIAGAREHHELVLRLSVDAIRALRPGADVPNAETLDVVWHHIANTRPGAEGHAGITGLDGTDRKIRKIYRWKLADIAQASPLDLQEPLEPD
jgi:hypothetical protein